jgi:alpha 1,2-mannosyltransferase
LEFKIEAGQLLIDKARYFKVANTDNVSYPVALGSVWHALHLSLYMQNKNEFYFKLILGDKDTFRFGWEATKTPYHMVTHFPGKIISF